MFSKFFDNLHSCEKISIDKYIINNGKKEDASKFGAFAFGTLLEFSVRFSRNFGAYAVVLRINRDGEEYVDIPLEFNTTDNGFDIYKTTLDLAELCKDETHGLFYYEFLLLRGDATLFTDSVNNCDFRISQNSANKFRMLVYERGFQTPHFLKGAIMYHIFVDRFCKGEGPVGKREDAVFNDNWYSDITQFAEFPGGPLKNNEFFGGNLFGVCEKLEYLHSLGVSVIYLSPIFKAFSNHKYDTGDYMKVDEMFGGEDALKSLIKEAERFSIKIILDGVFNHTGDDSKYFNRYNKYDSCGAYFNVDSPYRNWYRFKDDGNEYESWWGISILPKLNHECSECLDFFVGNESVASNYTRMGIGGWRLDVADELSNEFLELFRKTVKKNSEGDAAIIGEVWENAADKVSYGKRRKYFLGEQLDSVMNYPIRNGILSFVLYGDAEALYNVLVEIYSSYPLSVCNSLMNVLGTHDTERILSVLSGDNIEGLTNAQLATYRMNRDVRNRAVKLLKIAAAIQYTVYGFPSLYYGDEVGIEGFRDPFCRRTFPWGKEDKEILSYYRTLGKIRRSESVFIDGNFNAEVLSNGVIAYSREKQNDKILVIASRRDSVFNYPINEIYIDMMTNEKIQENISVLPDSVRILKKSV